MVMKLFPKDCDHNCEHYRCYDLSIDDYVSCCELLKMQCDDCDMDYCFVQCPLEKENNRKDD
jgi:hypothetical protein